MTPIVIDREAILLSAPSRTAKFEGYQHGGVNVSFFWSDVAAGGGGSELHRHPYIETFVMLEGEATFRIGSDVVTLTAGQVAVAPANTPHKFTNVGGARLQVLGIHANERVIQEDLDENGGWKPHQGEGKSEPVILNISDLPHGEFVGEQHGNPHISFMWVDAGPGFEVPLHRHPYPEVFVVREGQSTFRVGESSAVLTGGQIAVVPSNTPHGFINSGERQLLQVDIHINGKYITEWLE